MYKITTKYGSSNFLCFIDALSAFCLLCLEDGYQVISDRVLAELVSGCGAVSVGSNVIENLEIEEKDVDRN